MAHPARGKVKAGLTPWRPDRIAAPQETCARAGTAARLHAFVPRQQNRRPAMRKPFFLLPLLAVLALAACETMEGAGRDISTAGEALTQESQKAQSGM
jgi:entericidin B